MAQEQPKLKFRDKIKLSKKLAEERAYTLRDFAREDYEA